MSKVTNLSGMFEGATAFAGDVSKWDVSQVTNMMGTFNGASSTFNSDLSD